MNNFLNSTNIYVSEIIGNDSLSGYTHIVNGYGDGPVKTIERAIEMIKSMRTCGIELPVTIKLMSDITLSKTVKLNHLCKNVTIESSNEHINIYGGIKVSNFAIDNFNGKKCLSAVVPSNLSTNFTDLYVNGKRASIATFPKNRLLKAQETEKSITTEAFSPSKWFKPYEEDLLDIDDLEQATVSFVHYFIDEHTPIEYYDRKANKIFLKYTPCMTMNTNYESPNSSTFYYYLENIQKGFSEINDWYIDHKTNKLYFIPESFDNLESIDVRIPIVKNFFEISGEDNNLISGVRLKNLSFLYSKGDYVGKNENTNDILYASDQQSWVFMYGSLQIFNAFNCEIYNCNFDCIGAHAIEIGENCKYVAIDNCKIQNIGGGGIKVFGNPQEDSKPTSYIKIVNNTIHDCGQKFMAACGILSAHSSSNEISNNIVYNIKYTGISVGWIWGYDASNSYANIIRHNHVYHIGYGRLSDMSAIYLLGKQDGTIVEKNIVHDVESAHGGTYGLYADEGTSNTIFENNVVYNSRLACLHVHLGNQNVIKDNVFCFGGKNIINVSLNENHIMAVLNNNYFVADEEQIYGNSYKHLLYPNPSFYSNFNTIIGINKKPILTRIGENKESVDFNTWQKIYGLDIDSREKVTKYEIRKFLNDISTKIDKLGIELSIKTIKEKLVKYKND